MRVRLISLDGGKAVELQKDLTLVGRAQDCDIRFAHKSVSKAHCVLAAADGMVLVRDLGSTNGTRVNGQRVRRAALLPGDQLSVANFRFQVQFGDGDGDGPPADATPPPVADGESLFDSGPEDRASAGDSRVDATLIE